LFNRVFDIHHSPFVLAALLDVFNDMMEKGIESGKAGNASLGNFG
jgi:hypothetical protein